MRALKNLVSRFGTEEARILTLPSSSLIRDSAYISKRPNQRVNNEKVYENGHYKKNCPYRNRTNFVAETQKQNPDNNNDVFQSEMFMTSLRSELKDFSKAIQQLQTT